MTLCTEKEAAGKWCPLVRFKFSGTGDTPSCNREPGMGPGVTEGTRCIGSRCMAWRFDQFDVGRVARGYCGAFGKIDR